MTDWQRTHLGEILSRSTEIAQVQPEDSYKEITVKLWGKGVVLRGIVSGAELNGSRRFLARQGQLIFSRIDARNGAIGLVPASLDGAVVTTDFPLSTLDQSQVMPLYFNWLSKTAGFVELCRRASEGTTNRVRLQENRFLDLEIELPSPPEQRRIVARIEELAAKINEGQALRQRVTEEIQRLSVCIAHRSDLNENAKLKEGWHRISLAEVMQLVDDSHRVNPNERYPNLGIYSFGRGLFHKPPIDGSLTSATRLRRVRKGQFIYSRLFAFEGAYGFVTAEFDGCFVSNEYPTFECHASQARAEFVAAYFKSPAIWKEVAAGSKGLGDRRQRVQPDKILSHALWLPPLEWQNRIAYVQAQLDALKKLQAETAAELDAMLPSILDKAFTGEL